MAATATAQLFQNQLAALAHQMGKDIKEKFGDQVNDDQLQALLDNFIANQDIEAQIAAMGKPSGKSKKPKGERKPRAKKEVSPESLCEARVWGDGKSSTQCSFSKADGGCFCTKHQKQAAVTCQPCQTNEDGSKRIGLFMGRIDDWQDGEVGVLPYKDQNGLIRIDWESEEMRARVSEELESGTIQRPDTGIGAKKTKGGKKKKQPADKSPVPSDAEIQSANELASALEESPPPKEADGLLNAIGNEVDSAFAKADTNGDGVLDKEEFEAYVNDTKPQSTASAAEEIGELMAQMDDPLDNAFEQSEIAAQADSADDDGEIEIEEREWEGFTFQVDAKTNNIHYLDCEEDDEDYGAIMGTWTDEGPELEEEWAERLEGDDDE